MVVWSCQAISGIEVHESTNVWVDKIRTGKLGAIFFEIRKPEGSDFDWVMPLEDDSKFLPSQVCCSSTL